MSEVTKLALTSISSSNSDVSGDVSSDVSGDVKGDAGFEVELRGQIDVKVRS